MKWISVKDSLPTHTNMVLVMTSTDSTKQKGCSVVQFIDSKKMNEIFRQKGFMEHCVDEDETPYYFCSQEIKGNILNNVTHWMELPAPPNFDCQDDNEPNGLDSGAPPQ